MPDTVLYVYIQYLIYSHNHTLESELITLTWQTNRLRSGDDNQSHQESEWRIRNWVQAVYLPTSERGHDYWEPNLPDLPHLQIFRILDQTRLVVLNGEQFCHPENIWQCLETSVNDMTAEVL